MEASKSLVYTGTHDVVRVEDPDLGVVANAERGKPVDIPEAVANSLLCQDTWNEAKPVSEKKKGDA